MKRNLDIPKPLLAGAVAAELASAALAWCDLGPPPRRQGARRQNRLAHLHHVQPRQLHRLLGSRTTLTSEVHRVRTTTLLQNLLADWVHKAGASRNAVVARAYRQCGRA